MISRKNTVPSLLVATLMLPSLLSAESWKETLHDRLAAYGHRNWIVVADSAYPKQSAAGIETVVTGASQMEVLETVLEAIDMAPHVRPVIRVDAELQAVPENLAPGISDYRKNLQALLGEGATIQPHEEIIHQLDEASQLVNVLILKSDMVLPYTSVFIELDCGYWSAEAEAALRKSMQK